MHGLPPVPLQLAYQTLGSVVEPAATRIRERARRVSPRGGWWVEGLSFRRGGLLPEPLVGTSRLMHGGGVSQGVDMAMGSRDAGFIVRQLCWWSYRYALTWMIAANDHDFGRIQRGVPSPRLLGCLTLLAGVSRFAAGTPVLYFLRRRALQERRRTRAV